MKEYRKKPIVIEATQWFKNGDHPEDKGIKLSSHSDKLSEGKVVRYFRRPDISGNEICKKCGKTMHYHGWIDTGEQGYTVCPGDWIIKGVKGGYYPIKDDIFQRTYEGERTRSGYIMGKEEFRESLWGENERELFDVVIAQIEQHAYNQRNIWNKIWEHPEDYQRDIRKLDVPGFSREEHTTEFTKDNCSLILVLLSEEEEGINRRLEKEEDLLLWLAWFALGLVLEWIIVTKAMVTK